MLDAALQQLDAEQGHLLRLVVHGSQFRLAQAGIGGIIIAHHGGLLGDADARPEQGFQHTRSGQILTAENAVRADALGQKLLHHADAVFQRLAGFENMPVCVQTGSGHPGEEAFRLGSSAVGGLILDIVEVPASGLHQMLHGHLDAPAVIDHDRIGVRQSQRAVGKDDGHFAQKVLHLCPLTDGVENRADQDEAVHLLLRHSLQGAQRLRPVAAGVAEDDLVPSAAKLALDGVGCAGIVGIPDVHCEHGHGVQALADHALCNGTGGVVAAFEHLFHFGAGVGADSIFVVEHAGDGGDRDAGFPCNIVNIHRPSCKIRCGWMVKAYPAAVWLSR